MVMPISDHQHGYEPRHGVGLARDEVALREAFIGVLSHELRTPVTSIYGGIELLRAHRLDDNVVRDVLRDVSDEAEGLQRLIDDLLVMVRAERGLAFAVPEPVLLRRIVGLAVDDERRRWPDQAFDVDLAADLPTALGDDALLRQVLRNVLGNAAKFGPAHGSISVSGQADGDLVELRVRDRGPGISPEQREQVFALFYRGATLGRIAGSGIGLYVARVLMNAMGGSIHVAPREQGAEFVLRLPRYVDPEAPASSAA